MNFSTFAAMIDAQNKPDKPLIVVSAKLASFVEQVAMQNRRIKTERLIAAYISCARRIDIQAGVELEWMPFINKVKITYRRTGKQLILPVNRNDYELCEKLFSMFLKPKYLLKTPLMLNSTLTTLHGDRYRMQDVLKMPITPKVLRLARLYVLLNEEPYLFPKEVLWVTFLGSFDSSFKTMKLASKASAESYFAGLKSPPDLESED